MSTVPVRDASTVVLLRDGASGIEAWLLTRARHMVFAAGMAVFPGGRVDGPDADLPFAVGAEDLTAARFACEPNAARALLGAAVRETFEETGVLLTAPSPDLAAHRADVEEGRIGFGELLREHNLVIEGNGLVPWARWVTPAGEVRRYDARFFVAALPTGAHPEDLTSESSTAGWFAVHDAIALSQRGELGLMPPTLVTLKAVGDFESVAAAIDSAQHRTMTPVQPTVTKTEDGRYVVVLPDGTSHVLPKALFL